MKIKNLFVKNIERDIQGVVTIGNEEEYRKQQELEEYVCTHEVIKNFRSFFSAFRKSIQVPTENIGVWITGFFGSGKSHFLKILGYLLSNETVNGKNAIEYFDDKIEDPSIKADISLSAAQRNLVVLFNIDAKARSDAKNRNAPIMETMLNAFNEKLGYCGSLPWLAECERILDSEGKYEKFKEIYEKNSGKSWIETRHHVFLNRDKFLHALEEVNNISYDNALAYFNDSSKNYSINVTEFANIVNEYCIKNNRRVVFLIDEVGQFIGTRGEMMLGLQTVEEELGKICKGKAWFAVTSQQEIKELVEGAKSAQNDFSKIQGRFATRLMMSSSNADEVIRKRLLDKTEDAQNMLGSLYGEVKDRLNNLLIFPLKPKWSGFDNQKHFVLDYPFVTYQYELLQMTFTAIRESGMAEGKHISSGERSLMNAFQKSAISKKDLEVGELIPFNDFYDTIEEFMDHDVKLLFSRAEKRLGTENSFDLEVLKVLFMLKNVKEMEPTLERISTLMVSNIYEDKKVLKDKIKASLDRLIGETFAQQNGDRYEFLTDEEQDVNREIKKSQYSTSEVLNKVRDIFYDSIVEVGNKYTYGKYQFGLNRFIDDVIPGTENSDYISVKIYTPWMKNDVDLAVASLQSNSLVIDLTNGVYLEELIQANRILTYDRNHSSGASSTLLDILTKKRAEATEREKRAEKNIKSCIENCDFYLNGALLDINSKDAKKKFAEAMEKAILEKYSKLRYVNSFANKNEDIAIELRTEKYGFGFDIFDINICSDALALKEIYERIKEDKTWQKKSTVATITSRFTKAPYGYRSLDIRRLIAKLLVNEKLRVRISDQIQNINSQNFIYEFSRGNQDDRMVLEIKTELDPTLLMTVKKVMKDAFDVTIAPKEVDLKNDSLNYFKNKLESLKKIHYSQTGSFPGKQLVESMISLFSTIVSKTDSEAIFKIIIEKAEELYVYGEKIDSIINFYNEGGSQMKTWKKAIELEKYYQDNKLFINGLEQMSDLIDQINHILNNPEPFNMIAKLGECVSDCNIIKENLLSTYVIETERIIKSNFANIEKEYNEALLIEFKKQNTKEEIIDLFNSEKDLYTALLSKLDSFEKINASKDKSFTEVTVFRAQLSHLIKLDNEYSGGTPGTLKKQKNIKASELIPVANKKITSSDDINRLLENIKDNLYKLLEAGNDEINIE